MTISLWQSSNSPHPAHRQAVNKVLVSDAFTSAIGDRPCRMSHNFTSCEELTLQGLAALATSLPPQSIRCLDAKQYVFVSGEPGEDAHGFSEMVLNIDNNHKWMVMKNIEQVPAYRQVVDSLLEPIRDIADKHEGGINSSAGFVYLLSPKAETPACIAPEHNVLVQLQGSKDICVAPFPDDQSRQHEIERYCDGQRCNISRVPPLVQAFRLREGQALYLPPWLPHWVLNGDKSSVCMSVKFCTRKSERYAAASKINAKLRNVGLNPMPIGKSEIIDLTKSSCAFMTDRLREWIHH